MENKIILKIKEAIRANFNESPDLYDTFEGKYSFFRELNKDLLSGMTIPDAPRILDVGCGSAASSAQMMEDIPGAHVCGLDISEAMIEKARRNYGHMDGLELMVGDAARLNEYFHSPFDAIVYSASIFLIPDYGLSLKQARELLTPGGSVGLTFMDGLYDDQGGNLIAKVETEHSIGISLKRAVKLDDFREGFRETFNSVDSWTRDYNLPSERLREFFSVPAMSAGLFPSLPYEKRLEKLDELFSHLPANGVGFRWFFMTGGA